MKPIGLIIIAVLLFVPWVWLPSIGQGRDWAALVSQYLGLAALITMASAQIIATRWRIVETVFGPMDQSYRLHKWLGIGAMVLILLHDTIDAEMKGLGRETVLSELGETLGELSLYGLLILVFITIATFIPYHLWRWTHRFIGVFFVSGALHFLLIQKPFKNLDPLGLYMSGICLLGVWAFAFALWRRRLGPQRRYSIHSITRTGGATAISMKPVGKPLHHEAGQFAFFSFDGLSAEPHPFTLSAAPNSACDLRVTIAPLGDFTTHVINSARSGQSVTVDGPYGHFGQHVTGAQLWIAAGVGITPFVALAKTLAPSAAPVTLFYSAASAELAPHLAELEALTAEKPNFNLIFWPSRERGRADAARVLSECAAQLAGATVLFCGPAALRKSLATALRAAGLPAQRFRYEAFEIRTGIGLRKMADWLWRTARPEN